jgi:alpha-galactosidase
MEPEMVNPESELFEKHPDWVIAQPKRELELQRNQMVLDLTRPEVQQFEFDSISNILSVPDITYAKWDCNRYLTQPGSSFLAPDRQSHLWIDYVNALYTLMDKTAKTFPNTELMLCSGGGGRVDYGALKYFHTFWPSDNTDPEDRVFIQWGFSHFFPADAIAAHVTRMGNRPLKFSMDVAMSGALGLDLDVCKLSPEDKEAVASGVAIYKSEIRDVVGQGDLYRLESPYGQPRAAMDYVSNDGTRAVLFVYQLQDEVNKPVKLCGLNPNLRYRVQEVNLPIGVKSQLKDNDQIIDGETLMRDGLVPPCRLKLESAVVMFAAEK